MALDTMRKACAYQIPIAVGKGYAVEVWCKQPCPLKPVTLARQLGGIEGPDFRDLSSGVHRRPLIRNRVVPRSEEGRPHLPAP